MEKYINFAGGIWREFKLMLVCSLPPNSFGKSFLYVEYNLHRKIAVCISNIGKNTKHTRHIPIRMNFVRNGEEWNLHKTVWCEGGLQLEYNGTNNVREDEFNPRLGSTVVRFKYWHNICTRGLIGDRRFWRTRCHDDFTGLSWEGLISMSLKRSISLEWWKEDWKFF